MLQGAPYKSKDAYNQRIIVHVLLAQHPFARDLAALSPRHLVAVHNLPSAQQEELLRHANSQKAGTRALARRATELRRKHGERRGARAQPSAAKLLAGLKRSRRELEALRVHAGGARGDVTRVLMELANIMRLVQEIRRLLPRDQPGVANARDRGEHGTGARVSDAGS